MNMRRIVLASVLGVGLVVAGTGAALAHGQQGMMMQPGKGQTMCPGMMMGQGMGPVIKGPGMMMRQGMTVPREQAGMAGIRKLLSVDDAKEWLESWLAEHLGDRVKVGAIKFEGVFAISAEIKTVDDSLIENVIIDRRNGSVWRTE